MQNELNQIKKNTVKNKGGGSLNSLLKLLTIFILLIVSVFILINKNINVKAESLTTDLHTETRIYSKDEDTYYNGCEDFINYKGRDAEITVLIHGYSCHASAWSNRYGANGFIYNEDSIVNKIYNELNGEVTLYIAKGNLDSSKRYSLIKYSYNDYVLGNDKTSTDRIDDVSKHIIIVYDSAVSYKSNKCEYEEFDKIVDGISKEYKDLTGRLPRFNFVTHSRGGMTGIQYATYHPYNVVKMYTMGSPFSGSTLGNIELTLKAMEYVDDNYEVKSDYSGITSILDEDELISIRNAWNANYREDADLNVVAIGSVSSFSQIVSVLTDIIQNPNKYPEYYQEIVDVVNKINNHIIVNGLLPNSTTPDLEPTAKALDSTTKTLEILATVLLFKHDVANRCFSGGEGLTSWDALIYLKDENLVNKFTSDEFKEALRLITLYNDGELNIKNLSIDYEHQIGEVSYNEIGLVVADDLFIDFKSQLGCGFSDGVSYNGFERYYKIFTYDDLSDNRCTNDLPAIVHNLEIMNPDLIDYIVSNLSFGYINAEIEELRNDYSQEVFLNKSKAFIYNANYTNTRQIIAKDCSVSVYTFEDNRTLKLIDINTNNKYYFEKNKCYLIIIESSIPKSVDVSFLLTDCFKIGNNYFNVYGFSSCECNIKLEKNDSGYYLIELDSPNIVINGAEKLSSKVYYIYLNRNKNTKIILTNNSNTSESLFVKIRKPDSQSLNSTLYITEQKDKVKMYTNKYSYSQPFNITIPSSSNVSVFNANNEIISSSTTYTNKKIVTFVLKNNESCYIIYSNVYINVNLSTVDEKNLTWIIDEPSMIWSDKENQIAGSGTIMLPKGKVYDLDFKLFKDGQPITSLETDGISLNNNNNNYNIEYNFSKGCYSLEISSKARIGDTICINPTNLPQYKLNITVGYDNNFKWSYTNDNLITINFLETFKPNTKDEISIGKVNFGYKISDNGSYERITLEANKYYTFKKDKLDLIKNNVSISIIVYSVWINEVEFVNNTNCLNISDLNISVLFGNGNGTTSNPYQISCFRHLNNIKYHPNLCYILTKDIDLTNETWVPISNFNGTLDGNGKSIDYMNFKINTDNNKRRFGFIETLNGTVKNLKFSNVYINTCMSSSSMLYIGVIAGEMSYRGNISNCEVLFDSKKNKCELTSSLIKVMIYNSYVGGIVGYNNGTINSCDVDEYDFEITSKYCGGITGYNAGNISNCDFFGDITYYYDTVNGSIGGIAGMNTKSGTLTKCMSIGCMYWTCPKEKKSFKSIAPKLGAIIGENYGTYTKCGAGMDYDFTYYSSNFIFNKYNQGKYIFTTEDGAVGYQS